MIDLSSLQSTLVGLTNENYNYFDNVPPVGTISQLSLYFDGFPKQFCIQVTKRYIEAPCQGLEMKRVSNE